MGVYRPAGSQLEDGFLQHLAEGDGDEGLCPELAQPADDLGSVYVPRLDDRLDRQLARSGRDGGGGHLLPAAGPPGRLGDDAGDLVPRGVDGLQARHGVIGASEKEDPHSSAFLRSAASSSLARSFLMASFFAIPRRSMKSLPSR